MFPPAWAVACMYVNVHFVPIFFPAGGVNASAGVLLSTKKGQLLNEIGTSLPWNIL